MKRLIVLGTLILIMLGGSYFIMGSEIMEPENYNFSIINETDKKFKKIGISNDRFATILTDVNDENLEEHKELYFYIDKIKNNSSWVIQAIDQNGEIYNGNINIGKNEKLKIVDIVENNLITDKDCKEKIRNLDFDIKKLVKNWEYKIDNKEVKSKYTCDYKNSTEVMGKNNKLKSSEIVEKNNEAYVSLEKGLRNYSWVNIYY